MKTVLTIAGFDPSSGAGVTADLMVFAAHGLFGTSCITALTVQSTVGVQACHPVEARTIADALACLDDDLPPDGIKIGMLGTEEVGNVVCDYLERLRRRGSQIPIVVDPVLRASSGRSLLGPGGAHMLRTRLLPLADWVTPNHDELGWLTEALDAASGGEVAQNETVRSARTLQLDVARHGGPPIHILAKNGEAIPPDDLMLTPEGEAHWLRGQHIVTRSTHGTGCALSSALLCRLVLGDEPVTAAHNAKLYVAEALRTATPLGRGHGPMNHLWPLR